MPVCSEPNLKPEVRNTQLYRWLNAKDYALAGRMLHIREELLKWMPYVAQLFPHYPSHAVDHSDRIIVQLSRLLFNNTKPVVKFSTPEVYCLLCAAYLHDMGMVVSPGDTATILASDQWRKFVAPDGKGHELFQRYVELRERPIVETEELSAFLAGQALRYVIADFVRRDHHESGKNTLELHPPLRQLVDDGDSVAFETIADVGVAHGLQESDLADESRFPEERDVFGGKVNVRFLARLLRIGDLLDMSSKRADPTTARAIGPLPSDAVPHWQQYSAKKHENITPKIIEFTFECKDQDAHRVLRDWFGWLEAEVRAAGLEQLHAARHNNWKAPHCLVSSQASAGTRGSKHKATVIIQPAANAKYTFHDWKLELDHDLVLQRLIHDVYDNPAVFVRELIQNALDATRCQMYADFALQHPDASAPERPTWFDRDFRERYLVSISFAQEEVQLSPDGPRETRAVFTIEDRGTGMSEEIIRRYFLQVGRSYYQSSEFRERYKFAPTSRFGIGFLSVFAVSKDITVDTARRDNDTGRVTGIRLRLREPRNFLLTEPWAPFEDRNTSAKTGTRIRIVLNDWRIEKPLLNLVRGWCVAVEVPIIVKEAGAETIIRPERLPDRAVLAAGLVDPEARFILRTFEIASEGVEGQVAVIAYDDALGEGWCDCWPGEKDLGGDRLDKLPKLDNGYTALHGVTFAGAPAGTPHGGSQWIRCCDVRSGAATSPLARSEPLGHLDHVGRPRRRSGSHWDTMSLAVSAVESTTRIAVESHLNGSPRVNRSRGIYYVGRVLSLAPLSNAWRDQFPRTVITWQNGNRADISVAELFALNEIVVSAWTVPDRISREPRAPMNRHPREIPSAVPIVSLSDTPGFCDERLADKISWMNLVGVESSNDLWLFRFSATETNPEIYRAHSQSRSWVVPNDLKGAAGLRCDFLGPARSYFHILDRKHPVMHWLCLVREWSMRDPANIKAEHVDAAWLTASTAWYEMGDLLARWNKSPTVPAELKPPGDKNEGVLRFYCTELVRRQTLPPDSNLAASRS
jgi:molecular chaperone HtpG